jgi:hypothetical protein
MVLTFGTTIESKILSIPKTINAAVNAPRAPPQKKVNQSKVGGGWFFDMIETTPDRAGEIDAICAVADAVGFMESIIA